MRLIIDDFFPVALASQIADEILSGPFEAVTSPTDGVEYPGINREISEDTLSYVRNSLEEILEGKVTAELTFARVSHSKLPAAPHKVHCDAVMGTHACLIYLNEKWPSDSGTSFWTDEGQSERLTDKTDRVRAQRNANDLTRWQRREFVEGKFNRALIYDAKMWHCAEPIGGWGSSVKDGRTVLTCFFTLESP